MAHTMFTKIPSLYNHAPEARKKTIVEVQKNIKEKAQSTRDKPLQISQEVMLLLVELKL